MGEKKKGEGMEAGNIEREENATRHFALLLFLRPRNTTDSHASDAAWSTPLTGCE